MTPLMNCFRDYRDVQDQEYSGNSGKTSSYIRADAALPQLERIKKIGSQEKPAQIRFAFEEL